MTFADGAGIAKKKPQRRLARRSSLAEKISFRSLPEGVHRMSIVANGREQTAPRCRPVEQQKNFAVRLMSALVADG